jgi:hypothetical protein
VNHDEWSRAAGETGTTIHHVRVGVDARVDDEWMTTCGVSGTGAVLVRPDQHIAWMSTQLPHDIGILLTGVLTMVMGARNE